MPSFSMLLAPYFAKNAFQKGTRKFTENFIQKYQKGYFGYKSYFAVRSQPNRPEPKLVLAMGACDPIPASRAPNGLLFKRL